VSAAYSRICAGIRTSGEASVNSTAQGSANVDGRARSHGRSSTAWSATGRRTSTSDSPVTTSSVCAAVTWK
jgi:hypothetical protein